VSDRFEELRRLILENDRRIVAAVEERLALVEELWRLKRERGAGLVDPERERALRDALAASSGGRLSRAGLDRLVDELLALTKRELGAS
jgi:chorismate mutase